MNHRSSEHLNNPDPAKRRSQIDVARVSGNSEGSAAQGDDAAVAPTDVLNAEKLPQAPDLEPWRQQLVLMRAAAYITMAPALLERAGALILFPTENECFTDGQAESIDRYIAFRDDFAHIFKDLMTVQAWSVKNLPTVLGGLNGASVNPGIFGPKFERLVFARLEDLKQLCTDAVGLHKEVFERSAKTNSRGTVGVDRIADEGDVLDGEAPQGEQRVVFNEFDCELRAISNLCDWLSYPVSNPDEAVKSCRLNDFLLDKARALTVKGTVDPTAVITGKLSSLAVVLEQSAHLLNIATGRSLDEWRLARPSGAALSRAELSALGSSLKPRFEVEVEEVAYWDGQERRKKVMVELTTTKLGELMLGEYRSGYPSMAPYFDSLKLYALEQGIGFVACKDKPAVQLYIDAAEEKTCRSLTRMGPYPGQDGGQSLADEDEGEEGQPTDPRVVDDVLLSVSPHHRRGIFIECAQAAFASKKAFSNFQVARNLIHTLADLEPGFETATLKAYSTKGHNDGAGLREQFERNGFTLALTSTAELNPNFRLENEGHPLSRALPCDEELEAEARGWASHTWGPILTEDRTRRLLLVEAGAFGDPKVLKPVENILRHAHPLFLSVAVRQAGKAKQDQGYREVAQELRKLADQLEQIKNELGGKRLYVAQLDILSEQAYPGFKNVVAVYNIYDSHGVLVSRVNVERQGTSPADVTLVPRTLDGRDLKRAEKEVLTVLESCGAGLRHTHTDVRNHFADRHIYLCDTVVQAICWAAEPDSNEGPEEAIANIFRGPSVWIEREAVPEDGTRLYVFSQREREYS